MRISDPADRHAVLVEYDFEGHGPYRYREARWYDTFFEGSLLARLGKLAFAPLALLALGAYLGTEVLVQHLSARRVARLVPAVEAWERLRERHPLLTGAALWGGLPVLIVLAIGAALVGQFPITLAAILLLLLDLGLIGVEFLRNAP
jgi:hypothetical protein